MAGADRPVIVDQNGASGFTQLDCLTFIWSTPSRRLGLLSGTPRKSRAIGATGGVLKKMGAFGVLLFKDFGSLLDLPARAAGRDDGCSSEHS